MKYPLLLCFVLMACSSPPERELDQLTARSDQKNCGDFTFANGTTCPQGLAEATACFSAESEAGRAAMISWRFFTIEGDPIVTFLFSGGTTPVTEIADNRADAFGDHSVSIRRCSSLELFEPEPPRCPRFSPVGCDAGS